MSSEGLGWRGWPGDARRDGRKLTNEWMRAPLASGRIATICFFRASPSGVLAAVERQPSLDDIRCLLEYLNAAARALSRPLTADDVWGAGVLEGRTGGQEMQGGTVAPCPDGDACPDAADHPSSRE